MPDLKQLAIDTALRHGIDPNYFLGLVGYESKFNPSAVSPTGAKGLAQFTQGTGQQYGLNRKNISDPSANLDALARLTLDNQKSLTKSLGRAPKNDELYLAHLQGASGASAGFRNPTKRAVDVFDPDAVAVNLPGSARGRLNTISAGDYQNLHRQNYKQSERKYSKIDMGDEPTLEALNPTAKTPLNPQSNKGTEAQIMNQLSPTETTNMARPSIPDAIREAMDETLRGGGKVRTAGFVPPGLTKGAATTRAGANSNVVPKGTMRDVEAEARRAQELKNVPSAEKQMGAGSRNPTPEETRALATWAEANDAYMAGRGPDPGPPPPVKGLTVPPDDVGAAPRVRDAGDPRGAADFRDGGPAQRKDSNLAAQNDPASQQGLAERIAGRGKVMGAPLAAAAGAGAVAVNGDPAVNSVMQTINRGAKADQQYVPKSPSMDPNDMMTQFAPVMKEVVKDPQAREAVKVLATKAVQVKARQDAMAAEVKSDPRYYASQQAAAQGDPNDPMTEQRMMRAVSADQNRAMQARRGQPVAGTQDPAVAAVQRQIQRPPQTVPPSPQAAAGPPPVVAQDDQRVPWKSNNPYPPGVTPTPGAYDPTGGVQNTQSSGQMPMDPAMMQLMQFFGGGGGGMSGGNIP